VHLVPTIFTKGDLLDNAELHARAFGCTTAGTMDDGVAAAFKKRWPALAEALSKRVAERKLEPGDVFVWSEGGETIYALAIQPSNARKADLAALDRAVKGMVKLAAEAGITRIGLPRLGAGPAGLDWMRVKSVLAKAGPTTSAELVVYEQFIRKQA
jgi:O-acetyl-ADP-ribose deacetylase (regulator of RNase III)